MFYVLAGANLNIGLLASLGLIGSVYIISRIIGRIGGAYAGAIIAGSGQRLRKYMGLALMAQAGVAIGLSLIVKHEATRLSLSKAGDI